MGDLKSFFSEIKEGNEEEDDFEVGEIIEMRVNEFPPVDLIVEVIDINENGLLLAEILEVNGETDEHVEGDIIFIPPDLFEWD
jgi:hypothetical protein